MKFIVVCAWTLKDTYYIEAENEEEANKQMWDLEFEPPLQYEDCEFQIVSLEEV